MSTTKARPQRKATFVVTKVKGKRVFTAVNKRAHKVARIAGKRTKLTVSELKEALNKRPNIHAFEYSGSDGKTLKKISL